MTNIQYQVTVKDSNSEMLSAELKDLVEHRSINGVVSLDFEKNDPVAGQMGVTEVLGALSIVVKSAQEPLTELVKALRDFVVSFRTEIEITNKDQTIKISSSRPQRIEELVKILLGHS